MAENYDLKAAAAATIEAPTYPYQAPSPRSYRPRIGLIGCGGITSHHLQGYRAAGWDIAAFQDLNPAAATARRDEYFPNATVCTTVEELLATPGLEVVDIATHAAVRVPLIEQAIAAGKHVLSQKPFVLDLSEGHRLVKLAADQGVKLAVNQNGRWSPYISYMRHAVRSGLIGTVGSVDISIHWDHTWTLGTPFEKMHHLLLHDFGIHWFDAACALFGSARATSVQTLLLPMPEQPIAPPLLGSSLIGFETGRASLTLNGCTRYGNEERWKVVGSQGTLSASGSVCGIERIEVATAQGVGTAVLQGSWFPDGFRGAMGELLCAIEANREPDNSAANNLRSLEVCMAALRSADDGCVIRL
ncbi:MAG TPA: Gfo/Idh/MocA family oxidoreductase [Luteolibacter sp.]|nr:Gfo/Idh/MocA family oxidoreductase [Luteolibacter sp.]